MQLATKVAITANQDASHEQVLTESPHGEARILSLLS